MDSVFSVNGLTYALCVLGFPHYFRTPSPYSDRGQQKSGKFRLQAATVKTLQISLTASALGTVLILQGGV